MEWIYTIGHGLADPNNLTALSTTIIALFTVVLTGVGYKQAKLTRESIDLARTEFVSSHRPRIALRDITTTGTANVFYLLVNTGDTDATIVESWVMAELVPNGMSIRPLRSAGHDDLGRLVIAAGEVKELSYTLPAEIGFSLRFPNSRKIGLEGAPPVLGLRYFAGTIVYADDRGVRRRTVFRRRWDDSTLSFVRLSAAEECDQEYAD